LYIYNLPWFVYLLMHQSFIFLQDHYSSHSIKAALISASDFPVYFALCMRVFVKSLASISSSPA